MRRQAYSADLKFGPHVYVVTYAFWSVAPHIVLGEVGEVFLADRKPTSGLGASARDALIYASKALQWGERLEDLVDGSPQSYEGDPESLAAAALKCALEDSWHVKIEWARALAEACGERYGLAGAKDRQQ